MKHHHFSLVRGGVAVALVAIGTGAIERLDLRRMVERTDGAILGRIVSSWTTDHPTEGTAARVFTHLRIAGEDLYSGKPAEWVVSFWGGACGSEVQWHPDMPSAADTRVGGRVLAFTSWRPKMGGVGMRGLYAAFGGLFRVEEGPRGEVVLGRGPGFAVEGNVPVAELRARIARERASGAPR